MLTHLGEEETTEVQLDEEPSPAFSLSPEAFSPVLGVSSCSWISSGVSRGTGSKPVPVVLPLVASLIWFGQFEVLFYDFCCYLLSHSFYSVRAVSTNIFSVAVIEEKRFCFYHLLLWVNDQGRHFYSNPNKSPQMVIFSKFDRCSKETSLQRISSDNRLHQFDNQSA